MTNSPVSQEPRHVDLSGTDAHHRLEMVTAFRRQMEMPPIAYSVDGTSVSIEAPIERAPRAGSLCIVQTTGGRLLVHVLATRIEVREGPALQVASEEFAGAGATMRLRIRAATGSGSVLGRVEAGRFVPLADCAPFNEVAIEPATREDVRAYHAWVVATAKGSSLELGSDPADPALRIHLHARGLARHTLFCGQSGSGKTFSLGVLLERVLVDTTLPMLILDPNSDHVHLGLLRTREAAEQVRAAPYTDEGWAQLVDAHAAAATGVSVVADLAAASARVGARNYRTLVFDLGALPDAAARHEASAMALEQVWASRRERDPMLIVLDEAHDVCPAEPTSDAQRHATELAIAIAGEGRKFGRHLLLATQRPQKLHPNVVSQCDNLFLLRMNSSVDVDDVAGSFSHVPAGLMHRATSFGQGMALVGGPLVPHPVLVRVDGRITPEGGSDVPTDWAVAPPVPAPA